MPTSNNLEKIKIIVKEFFEKITFELEIEFLSQKEQTLFINLKMSEPQILIGERGQTLAEIQHLLNLILRKKTKEVFYVDLDINGYKDKKIKYLKELARNIAEEVILTKKEKLLPPMPAHERRIIHLELTERKDVTTESIGQEPERRIIIKPYP